MRALWRDLWLHDVGVADIRPVRLDNQGDRAMARPVSGDVHIVLFNFLSILGMYSHLAVMLTDPGAVLRTVAPSRTMFKRLTFEQLIWRAVWILTTRK